MEQTTRSNEELVKPSAEHTQPELIPWHQDCSTMLQELGALKGKDQYIEMCLKLIAEAQMWKNHFEFRKLVQTKLEQKVNILMKKLETVESQLKVSLDSENNAREELKKMQQVAKCALMWGKALDAKGKLPVEQKLFFKMLQNQEEKNNFSIDIEIPTHRIQLGEGNVDENSTAKNLPSTFGLMNPPLANKLPSIATAEDSSARFQNSSTVNVPISPGSGSKNLILTTTRQTHTTTTIETPTLVSKKNFVAPRLPHPSSENEFFDPSYRVNERTIRAPKRSLVVCPKSPPCAISTSTKKARMLSDEQPPFPFPRPVVGALGIVVIPKIQPSAVNMRSKLEDEENSVSPDQDEISISFTGPSTEKSAVQEDVVEESPASLEPVESLQSLNDVGAPTENAVKKIPTSDDPQLSAFEIASETAQQQSSTCHAKAPSKMKRAIHISLNKFIKAPKLTAELLATTVDNVLLPDSVRNPSAFIKKLIEMVTRAADVMPDISATPPAPPLTATLERCIILLKAVDIKRVENDPTNTDSPHFYSDAFLSEVSNIMFQMNFSFTLEVLCSLARTYIALTRSRGLMAQARSFLFDCLYYFPRQSFALTNTVLSEWTEVLRHATSLKGLAAMDRTIAYLLLQCCKMEAVPGEAGKVLEMRSFLETTLGYKNPSYSSVDDLIIFFVSQLSQTHSVDEASSINWSLLLLARWEGVDLAIIIIEKHLWPFLQRWNKGDGTNAGAVSAIKCIGALGKSVPKMRRGGVKQVLGAMKTILDSDKADTIVQEAAAETLILLGEEEEPKKVVEVLIKWKPRCKPSAHLEKVMCFFLRRQSFHNV